MALTYEQVKAANELFKRHTAAEFIWINPIEDPYQVSYSLKEYFEAAEKQRGKTK